MKALQHIKDAFKISQQKEKEKFKYEMISGTINKNKAYKAFGVDNSQINNLTQQTDEDFDMSNLFEAEKNNTMHGPVQKILVNDVKPIDLKL